MTIEEYIEQNPNATVKEWLQFEKEYKNNEWAKQQEYARKKHSYYQEMLGKKYKIKFNDDRIIVFELTGRHGHYFAKAPYYEICSDQKTILFMNSERNLNHIWLCNPYDDHVGPRNIRIEEITEDQFNKVVEASNKIFEIVKETKDSI